MALKRSASLNQILSDPYAAPDLFDSSSPSSISALTTRYSGRLTSSPKNKVHSTHTEPQLPIGEYKLLTTPMKKEMHISDSMHTTPEKEWMRVSGLSSTAPVKAATDSASADWLTELVAEEDEKDPYDSEYDTEDENEISALALLRQPIKESTPVPQPQIILPSEPKTTFSRNVMYGRFFNSLPATREIERRVTTKQQNGSVITEVEERQRDRAYGQDGSVVHQQITTRKFVEEQHAANPTVRRPS